MISPFEFALLLLVCLYPFLLSIELLFIFLSIYKNTLYIIETVPLIVLRHIVFSGSLFIHLFVVSFVMQKFGFEALLMFKCLLN